MKLRVTGSMYNGFGKLITDGPCKDAVLGGLTPEEEKLLGNFWRDPQSEWYVEVSDLTGLLDLARSEGGVELATKTSFDRSQELVFLDLSAGDD